MEKIKVSVIVPIYNCEEYLEECIKSIINQTLNQIEIILVDDGSTDKSLEICNKYKQKDNRIKIIHQENQGVSRSRENGLKEARGEYISFIDADDYIAFDFLERLFEKIDSKKADLICCNSEDVGILTDDLNIKILKNEILYDSRQLYNDFFDGKRYMYTIWGKIVKKQILLECYFPHIRYTEDTYLMLEVANKSKKIVLDTYQGYFYRHNKQSVMQKSSNIDKYLDILTTDEFCYSLIRTIDENLSKKALKKILDDLYGGVATYSLYGNKKQFYMFTNRFDKTYMKINEKVRKRNVKNIIIFLFSKNKNFTKIILRIIYFLTGKYQKNGD